MPTTEQLTVQVEQEMKQEALTVVQRAKICKVTDQASYDAACSLLLNEIKPFRAKWLQYWDGVKKPAWAAYKAIQDKFNEGDKPLETAEKQVKDAIKIWDDEQTRIREELQRKAQAEAEERARIEREKEAEFAEMAGAPAEAVEAITAAPIVAVAAPVGPTFQRVSGMGKRTTWKCKVNDLKKLCLAIGKGQVSPNYVLPNMSALNDRAAADQSTMNIPGCVAYPDTTITGRMR